ncbi:hypothetical protein GCM10027592_43160 [Spirosoma flavus]
MARPQMGSKQLSDIAYGAGTYAAVGAEDGLIRISTDGSTWVNQVAGTTAANGLSAIVYAAGKFVTVGNNGRVLSSSDGLTWTSQVSTTSALLIGIAYGNGKFVAVGYNSTIITSSDGISWTSQVAGPPGPAISFLDVAYGSGNFVAVASEGVIKTSPDGVTWTTRTSGTTQNLYGVTAGGNGNFVAVGINSTIVTSPDGITWTPQTVASSASFLTGVAYKPTTGQFVAVANIDNKLLTSADGLTWTEHSSGTYLSLKAVHYLNGQFVAVGDEGAIRSSSDGINWKPLTIDYTMVFKGTAYGNGRYVAVGSYLNEPTNSTSLANLAVTSGDGLNYALGDVQQLNGGGNGLYDVAFGNGLFAAVGSGAQIHTSTDGKVWVKRYNVLFETLNGIAYGGGRFVAVGAGLTARSTDGITWTDNFTQSANIYGGVTYGGGQFVAVGFNGGIGTSPDGALWTPRTSGTTSTLNSIAYGNDAYVAVGVNGKALRSTDASNWTTIAEFAGGSDLDHVLFANSQFVAVGKNGILFTSPDGITWTARTSNSNGKRLYSLTHGNGQFVAVGDGATIVTSPDDNVVPPVNQPPVAPVIGNQSGTVNQMFTQTLPPFTDPEGLALTYNVTGLPAGLIFTAPATISGTPTAQGVSTVTITATDPGNLSTQATFTITINPVGNPGNFAITGVTTVNCQVLAADQRLLTFTPVYAGTNGQPVSFSVVNELLPTTNSGPYSLHMYIDNPTIALKATQSGTAGEASFSYNWLAVCDGVSSGNQAPIVVNTIPAQAATLNQPFNYVIPAATFADPNGDALTLSVASLPAGLQFTAPATISGAPTNLGTSMVTITATDGGNLSVSTQFILAVNPESGNGAFAITGVTLVSCQVVSANERLLNFSPQYAGLSGQPVSFSVVNEMLPTTNAGPYPLKMYIDNPTITLKATQTGTAGEASFTYNWLTACNGNGARKGTSESEENGLRVRLLGNPVENNVLEVEVQGAAGQLLALRLTDLSGQVIDSQQVTPADVTGQYRFEMHRQSGGMYLLQVSTSTQVRTLKVLKR